VILVTGGAGFIGSNIAADLAARGDRVVVCDVFGADAKWRNLAKHDLYDAVAPDDLDAWLARHGGMLTAIIHMGAISATTEADVDVIVRTNIALSIKLWDYARDSGIAFIYASSAATYGAGGQGFDDDGTPAALGALRPLNPYGWSKAVFDRRVARDVEDARPLPRQWAGLKFFNVYGPNEYHKGAQRSVAHQMFEHIRDQGRVRLFKSDRADISDGGQMRDFVYVRDCSAVVLWMLDRGVSGLFNCGTGKARSFADLARAAFAAMGKPVQIDYVPTPDALKGHYQYWTQANMTRLRTAGYDAPFMDLDDGVADYIKTYLATDDPYR